MAKTQDRVRPRAGTTRKPRFTVPLDDDTYDQLGAFCAANRVTKAVVAEDAIKTYLRRKGSANAATVDA
jgi:predicted transcriptional regulator